MEEAVWSVVLALLYRLFWWAIIHVRSAFLASSSGRSGSSPSIPFPTRLTAFNIAVVKYLSSGAPTFWICLCLLTQTRLWNLAARQTSSSGYQIWMSKLRASAQSGASQALSRGQLASVFVFVIFNLLCSFGSLVKVVFSPCVPQAIALLMICAQALYLPRRASFPSQSNFHES